MTRLSVFVVLVVVVLLPVAFAGGKKYHSKNKYSAEANRADATTGDHFDRPSAADFDRRRAAESNELPLAASEQFDPDIRRLHKPFRMSKLNMVWSKAQQRLTEPKLKSLFTDLKIQDKEELAWKQLNGQHKDKDGLKEAALRQKLMTIMSTYDLIEHFAETEDPSAHRHRQEFAGQLADKPSKKALPSSEAYKHRSLFKDKKLNKLWEKAEVSGFTSDELAALREEFNHHQDKVDMYFAILEDSVVRRNGERHENAVNEDEFDPINEIEHAEEPAATDAGDVSAPGKRNAYLHDANLLRDKHRDLRDNFDRLERIAAQGPDSQEFVEPKVQNLWRVANEANFEPAELASLRIELLHYESRLLKLRHLHTEQALNREKYKDAGVHQSKHDKYTSLDDQIKKQLRKVEKIHTQLEERIYLHNEL